MLTKEQAQQRFTELLIQVHAAYEEQKCLGGENDHIIVNERVAVAERQLRRFGEELAAMPQFFDVLQCWMVEVNGFAEVSEITSQDFDLEDTLNRLGGLAQAVQTFVLKHDFKVTSRSNGVGYWELGVFCSEQEARRLCSLLHDKFAKAIQSRQVQVTRKFWGWRWPL